MIIDTEDKEALRQYEEDYQNLVYEKRNKGAYDETDIMLVRVTDHVPNNGISPAICNIPFIISPNSMQNFVIYRYLKERYTDSKGETSLTEEEKAILNEKAKALTPLSTEYRSSVHFTLNGVVTNHMYGDFSGEVVIIEPFACHEDDSNIISVRPDDTYFKDGVSLSKDAVILVPLEMKDSFPDCGVEYVFYKGDRDLAVDMCLVKKGIVPEQIADSYIEESKTSGMLRTFISQKKYDTTRHFDSTVRAEDNEKSEVLKQMYDKMFYDYLFGTVYPNGEHRREYDLLITTATSNWIVDTERQNAFLGIVKDIGLEKYSQIVTSFNESIRTQLEAGQIKTNNELLRITPMEIPKHGNTK